MPPKTGLAVDPRSGLELQVPADGRDLGVWGAEFGDFDQDALSQTHLWGAEFCSETPKPGRVDS